MSTLRASQSPPPVVITTYVERPIVEAISQAEEQLCDGCGERIEGEPAGHGTYLWTRGEERREELVPLCQLCATALAVSAGMLAETEEEDGLANATQRRREGRRLRSRTVGGEGEAHVLRLEPRVRRR